VVQEQYDGEGVAQVQNQHDGVDRVYSKVQVEDQRDGEGKFLQVQYYKYGGGGGIRNRSSMMERGGLFRNRECTVYIQYSSMYSLCKR
jgi:hypothetical protein